MKSTRSQILLLVFVFLLGVSVVFGKRTVILDKLSDVFMLWKLQGGYIYYQNVLQFEDNVPRNHLPPDFDFKSFRKTQGIWLILPDIIRESSTQHSNTNSAVIDYNNEPSPVRTMKTVNTTVSFSFTSPSQLMESVGVRYCLYGKARIYIKKQQTIVCTITPSEIPAYEWVEQICPLPGSTRQFTIEADVQSPLDFVLIDRITGFYSETTTTTTTTTQQPSTLSTRIRTRPSKSKPGENTLSKSKFILGIFDIHSMINMLRR